MRFRVSLAFFCTCAVLAVLTPVLTRAADDDKKAKAKAAPAQRETVAKPMTERQKKAAENRLKKELETPYKKWLNEEVTYIITDE